MMEETAWLLNKSWEGKGRIHQWKKHYHWEHEWGMRENGLKMRLKWTILETITKSRTLLNQIVLQPN